MKFLILSISDAMAFYTGMVVCGDRRKTFIIRGRDDRKINIYAIKGK